MRVPSELLEYKQWVAWKRVEVNGRLTKLPISPWSGKAAASDQPKTWSTFRHARYAVHRLGLDGIGFVFTTDDPFCGIDLDDCRTSDGDIAPEVTGLVERFGSYAELSPSGTGVHILIKGKLRGGGRRAGKIELYDARRYFTLTGDHIPSTPWKIVDGQKALDHLCSELFPAATASTATVVPSTVDLTDDELIECAHRAQGRDRFRRLWVGDTSDYDGDHSRADFALCLSLAFWTGGDRERIDRLFRRSGLMRAKWDRRAGDGSYGTVTIQAALERGARRDDRT